MRSVRRKSISALKDPELKLIEKTADNDHIYEGIAEGDIVGHCGYVLRVLPKIDAKVSYEPNLIKWM